MSWLDTQTRKRSVERSDFFRFIAVQPMYSPPHHSIFRAGKDLINGLRIKSDQASDQFSNIKNFQEKKNADLCFWPRRWWRIPPQGQFPHGNQGIYLDLSEKLLRFGLRYGDMSSTISRFKRRRPAPLIESHPTKFKIIARKWFPSQHIEAITTPNIPKQKMGIV